MRLWFAGLRFESLKKNMRDLIIKYLNGQPLTHAEALKVIEEYMVKYDKSNKKLLEQLSNPMNPFAPGLLNQAVKISVDHLSHDYSVITLLSKENHILKVY